MINQESLFSATNICKSFHSGTEKIEILKDLGFSINQGEMIAIVGASGSGKTTLLQILGTLDSPDSGEILFNGRNLTTMSDNALSRFRNKSVGFIFQFHHLLPEFTALENVMMPGLIAGKSKLEMKGPAMKLLKQVELDHRTGHKVNELSGGEQQRTALARALIMKPALLLADEPTGNLDGRSGNIVFDLIKSLCRDMQLATIMVTHNRELAQKMDSTFTLENKILARQSTVSSHDITTE
ncbi:ABC-type antimicrobial peptide transport system, ATPase component [Desulfocapsa sulfexigens DSM 10523]|uniref:ABC-type antimicrobial peptide transport system, ATPase component n=1 Tax=Desulfocapsa sulfexigens (strain DSM 10523 / SB164P1) TaxID=1167006 RepID=M1PES8_DESSD|nr:ABC transporter ATP-binding protein [Desulfocapsa sulfexigens]AGF80052.1 ABC-type antimicrobial peptide transport system, ATPase component [Desulfocapsa sulfexigens DSM 10523]